MQELIHLQTERLILDRPTESDLDDFVIHMNSCEDFSKNLFNIPFPYTREDAENWLQKCDAGIESGEAYRFSIREKEAGKLIGIIGLHLIKEHQKAELGYWLAKDFWGKGYLPEALKSVLQVGFNDLKLNKIYATHFLHNPASGKVMQKVGMKFEGVLKQEYLHQGKFLDVNRYAILKKDFESIS